MTKRVALLLMMVTLFFVEIFLQDGGDLDRIAHATGSRIASVAPENSRESEIGEAIANDLRPALVDEIRGHKSPWDKSSDSRNTADDFALVTSREEVTLRMEPPFDKAKESGSLSPNQLNLE
jgi:hypothetical protein